MLILSTLPLNLTHTVPIARGEKDPSHSGSWPPALVGAGLSGCDTPLLLGLAIDFPESKLYWISSKNHTINRCNLDGSELEVIDTMRNQLGKATALAIMGEGRWPGSQGLEQSRQGQGDRAGPGWGLPRGSHPLLPPQGTSCGGQIRCRRRWARAARLTARGPWSCGTAPPW